MKTLPLELGKNCLSRFGKGTGACAWTPWLPVWPVILHPLTRHCCRPIAPELAHFGLLGRSWRERERERKKTAHKLFRKRASFQLCHPGHTPPLVVDFSCVCVCVRFFLYLFWLGLWKCEKKGDKRDSKERRTEHPNNAPLHHQQVTVILAH